MQWFCRRDLCTGSIKPYRNLAAKSLDCAKRPRSIDPSERATPLAGRLRKRLPFLTARSMCMEARGLDKLVVTRVCIAGLTIRPCTNSYNRGIPQQSLWGFYEVTSRSQVAGFDMKHARTTNLQPKTLLWQGARWSQLHAGPYRAIYFSNGQGSTSGANTKGMLPRLPTTETRG